MEQDYKYKVVTLCMTYNQASYIEETLHGFTMQETSFPMVFCIVDDASTDGEQMTILSRKIDFKTKAKASVISAVTSGVIGIAMAYMGFGVWSLVIPNHTNSTIMGL